MTRARLGVTDPPFRLCVPRSALIRNLPGAHQVKEHHAKIYQTAPLLGSNLILGP